MLRRKENANFEIVKLREQHIMFGVVGLYLLKCFVYVTRESAEVGQVILFSTRRGFLKRAR